MFPGLTANVLQDQSLRKCRAGSCRLPTPRLSAQPLSPVCLGALWRAHSPAPEAADGLGPTDLARRTAQQGGAGGWDRPVEPRGGSDGPMDEVLPLVTAQRASGLCLGLRRHLPVLSGPVSLTFPGSSHFGSRSLIVSG